MTAPMINWIPSNLPLVPCIKLQRGNDMKKILLTLIAASAIFAISSASAAAMKVAVVNLQKVIAASPQAKSADNGFKKKFQPRETKLKAAAVSLQKDVQDFQRNATVMSDKEKQTTEEKLTNERNDLQRQQTQFSQDVQTAQSKMMQTVFAKIKAAVGRVAKQGNYDLVLQSNSVVYYKDTYDITTKVINTLQ